MNSIRCILVDDEPLARTLLSNYISKLPVLKLLGSGSNAMEAQVLLKENKVDLMFLDIQLPDLTGLEFLKTLEKPPFVIFTTAYSEYAISAFDLDVVDYLVKPIPFDRFFKAVNKAISRIENSSKDAESSGFEQGPEFSSNMNESEENSNPYIFVKTDYKIVKINLAEIQFIQSLRDYVSIQLIDRKIISLQSLTKLEEVLPKKNFQRIHRSFIVNLSTIDSIEGNTVFINKHRIPISKRMRKEFLDKIDSNGLL